jgi:hypothetical protein
MPPPVLACKTWQLPPLPPGLATFCRVLPPRVSEIIGVFHAKAYCFDDTGGAGLARAGLGWAGPRLLMGAAAGTAAAATAV